MTKIFFDKTTQKNAEAAGFEIVNLGKYRLGNWQLEAPCKLRKLCQGRLKVGAFSYLQTEDINENTNVEIGRYCSIGANVKFNLGIHALDYVSTSDCFHKYLFKRAPICSGKSNDTLTIIENDVWIGEGVLIKSGVRIGTGAVVGAKALVTKDVPPYAIVGGVPAKILRFRFDDQTIKELLESKWWEYDYRHFPGKNLLVSNVDVFLKRWPLVHRELRKYRGAIAAECDFLEIFLSKKQKLKNFLKRLIFKKN